MSKGKWKSYKSQTNQKRTKNIHLRVTPQENEKLRNNAAELNLSLADYILDSTIFSDKKFACLSMSAFDEAIIKMVKADTNFNQAVHALNFAMYKKAYSPDDQKAMSEALRIIIDEHKVRSENLQNIKNILQEKMEQKCQ